jgi:phosphoglycolate phosphatase-like HAD superfamily hydrolase
VAVSGACESLRAAALVIWDFDGVIKESLDAKSDAFEALFMRYGAEVAARVRAHHEAHPGRSRFEKMPLYLSWAEVEASEEQVRRHCELFSDSVVDAVIDAPMVPGVREYLFMHAHRQVFVIASATPQEELRRIVEACGLADCFAAVRGAPTTKSAIIGEALRGAGCPAAAARMVGDAVTDRDAAAAHGVPFVLRRTAGNHALQAVHAGPSFASLDCLGGD